MHNYLTYFFFFFYNYCYRLQGSRRFFFYFFFVQEHSHGLQTFFALYENDGNRMNICFFAPGIHKNSVRFSDFFFFCENDNYNYPFPVYRVILLQLIFIDLLVRYTH